ncbi:hypothetical protein E2320_011090 [Naja naja]|uniref:Ribonuclease P/MRP subunit p40 n=1 Tax=Naja naja TaxID=35670 RepID=A0A8C6XDP7_NAJNA|nr:hypothetical protein E2320_011090 [Naja naja]
MFLPLRWMHEFPRHLLVCERSHVHHERSRHVAHVREHAFNCRVSFLIPDCGIVPQGLKNAVADFGEYYLVKNLFLHELVTQEFINTFVKKGSCYALTYNTRIDQDNTAALLPTGKLILSVDKDTYQELGLQGNPSLYSGKKPMRYIITVDLMDTAFTPENKKYKRIIWALKEKKPLEFDFLLTWQPTGSEEASLMSYFSKKEIQAHRPKVTFSTLRNVQCPILNGDKLHGEPDAACSTQEFFEWLGAIFTHVGLENTSSSFLSTYVCPQPSTLIEQALMCTITGFIPSEKIIHLLEQIW